MADTVRSIQLTELAQNIEILTPSLQLQANAQIYQEKHGKLHQISFYIQ